MGHDSNLLLGVYAVQMGLTTPDRVLEAAAACLNDPGRDVADYLVEAGDLSPSSVALLRGLVGSPEDAGNGKEAAASTSEASQSGSAGEGQQPALEELPGRYSREHEYARGGMGRVMVVHDRILGRDVALKEILSDDALGTNAHIRSRADLERRFIQEARITGQLEHPSIVPLYEMGRRSDGHPYYVMKLVQGRNLREVIRNAGSLEERLKLLPRYLDLCQAIAYAHSRGIIHRDIKSENVLLGQFGETAVIDWGLAKSRHETDYHAAGLSEAMQFLRAGDSSSVMNTAYGSALGTPAYMPPEQASGELDRIDERSDVYSLGVVLFEVLTGEVPFRASSLTDAVKLVIAGKRRPVAELEPNAPPELVRICDRATQHDPANRYQTAWELVEDVESFYNVWQADESLRAAYRELQETHNQLQTSRENELKALEDARTALDRAQRDLYLASIQLAANRISEHRLDLARGALAEAPEGERRWEWGYLVSRAFPHLLEAGVGTVDAGAHTGLASERWRGAVAREMFSVKAHGAYVTGVVANPERSRLLTSGADGACRLWEFPQARLLGTFSEGADVLQSAALSNDGTRVATTRTYHSTARIWDAGRVASVFELTGHKEPVGEIRFSSDDGRILTASADHTARLWDARSGQLLTTCFGHEKPLFDAAFSSDDRFIVTASADKTVRRWDIGSGEELAVMKIETDQPVASMRLSECGRYCLCAFPNGNGMVWDLESERAVSTHSGRIGRLDKPAFSPDSSSFVAPAAAGGATVYETQTGKALAQVGDRHEVLHTAVFDASGSAVLTGSVDGTVKAWTHAAPEALKQRGVLKGHDDFVYFADFGPDGRRVVTASYDRTACVWDTRTGELLARLAGHTSELQCAVFTEDGRHIVTGSWDLTRIVWDAETFEQRHVIQGKRKSGKAEFFGGARSEYNLGNSAILGRPIGPDSRTLLVRDNLLSHDAWDVRSGRRLYTLSGHAQPLTTQSFSRDGRYALTGSMSGESIVWDLATGSKRVALKGHRAGVTCADFSPDGARVVTSSLDHTAMVWNLATGEPVHVLRGHSGLVKTARFSVCGTRIVTSSVDTTAIVWDAESGRRLSTLIGHRGRMLNAMFSPDGRRVLTADYEMARVWDLAGHELVALGTGESVLFATWSADGRHIVTCHKDGTARLATAIPWEELGGGGEPDATLERRLQLLAGQRLHR